MTCIGNYVELNLRPNFLQGICSRRLLQHQTFTMDGEGDLVLTGQTTSYLSMLKFFDKYIMLHGTHLPWTTIVGIWRLRTFSAIA